MRWDLALVSSKLGGAILRYSLVLFFLGFGLLKFTEAEALAIQPLGEHSPFLSWLWAVSGPRIASDVIGVVEIACAIGLAVWRFAPRLSAYAGLATAVALVMTLSFLVTTPQLDPALQSFIIKDLTLLGAALWCAGEAFALSRERGGRQFSLQPAE